MTYFKIEPLFFIFSYFWSSHALVCNTVSSSSHLCVFILYGVNSLIARTVTGHIPQSGVSPQPLVVICEFSFLT